jgi:hypothetical protein
MAEDAPEMRTWLTDVLSRRVRRPALEETIFHQLDELERGPLEQLASLVRMSIDELRIARQRLDDQARDVRALQETMTVLNDRVDALLEPALAAGPLVEGHVLLVLTAEGYRIAEGEGPPPGAGAEIEHEGAPYRVLNRRPSPYPGDRRACALLLPVARPADEVGASGDSASAV